MALYRKGDDQFDLEHAALQQTELHKHPLSHPAFRRDKEVRANVTAENKRRGETRRFLKDPSITVGLNKSGQSQLFQDGTPISITPAPVISGTDVSRVRREKEGK